MDNKNEDEIEMIDSDIDTEELEEMEREYARDPNGFVYVHNLDTYKKSKKERIEEQ